MLLSKPQLKLMTIALLIAVVAVYLRLNQLLDQILIDDEWHAVHALIRLGYSEIFLSFGHADHSIPLTLLFKLMAESIGLSEFRMRLLPLMAGITTVVAIPYLLKPWLKTHELLLLSALLAVSPVLIHFSRYARPYALTILLTFAAVIALWHWWHEKDRSWLFLFMPSTVLAAWLHPLTLLFTGGGLLWFGLVALKRAFHRRETAGLVRIAIVGLMTMALVSVFVLPPLLADPASMASKTGVHKLEWKTIVWAWELSVGTANLAMVSLMFGFGVIGAIEFFKRDRHFFGYWLFMFLLASMAIVILSPAWVHHALVPVRYLSPILPLVLGLIAIGFVISIRSLGHFVSSQLISHVSAIASAIWLSVLVLSGPLIETFGLRNQFSAAQRYHFDYDFAENLYVTELENIELPSIYDQMAQEPGEWWLIEAPWNFASHSTPLVGFQRKHQMPLQIGMMTGLCNDWSVGELPYQSQGDNWVFRNLVHLADLPEAQNQKNRFVVLNRQSVYESIPLPESIEGCIDELSQTLGPAWHEDDYRVVYRLPKDFPAP